MNSLTNILTIYCYPNSEGFRYALENDIVFVILNYIDVEDLTLDISSLSMTVGGTKQLTATVSPSNADNKNVTWTSSDETVATVSQAGLVTAVSSGEAVITVTTADGGFNESCTVTVTVPTSGVSLDLNSAVFYIGKTKQLTAAVLPTDATNKNVTWTSSDETIATVSQTGLVTAVSAGSAVITVTTEDGDFKKECAITVKTPSIKIQYGGKDAVNELSYKISWWKSYSNSKVKLSYLAEGFDNDVTFKWSSDNKKVKVDNKGMVNNTGIIARSANITVTAYDKDGNAIATDTIKVIFYKTSSELKKIHKNK